MIRRTSESGIVPEGSCFSSAREETRAEISSNNVLLVDDDPSILTVLSWNLRDLGVKVTTALGGQGGFKRLCEQPFDMLITDFVMGDLDGLFLVKIAHLLHPEMKVIVMTGSPHLIPRSLPLSCQLDALLEKPFRLDEFKNLIIRIMGECVWKGRGENGTAQ
jgi:two-component system, cell cycle response regulator CpdR